MKYRFYADDFSVRLSWFYFENDFSCRQPSRVWSFEVNGLTDMRPGNYDLRFQGVRAAGCHLFSWDGEEYLPCPTDGGYFEVRNHPVMNFMVSCYWKDSGKEREPPFREVTTVPAGESFPERLETIAVFDKHRRNTRLDERGILENWDTFHDALMSPRTNAGVLKDMVAEIAEWSKRRQVMDESDTHFGAVYSEEDKYCFQDAAASAVLFMRMYRWVGDGEWVKRARRAKEYAYKGQHDDEGNALRFGAFPFMRSFGTPDYARLTYPLPSVDGVSTCIIANLLIKLFEEGMEAEPRDLERLRRIAVWIINNESHPGVFRHHEGDERGDGGFGDCQNTNAMGAGTLCRIAHFLRKQGQDTPSRWMEAAARGVNRVISGQEAIGEWPYLYATLGRGQRYAPDSVPDQGMGLYHLLLAAEHEPFRNDARLLRVLRRAACWYLCMCHVEAGTGLVNLDYDANFIGFSSFT